MVQSNDPVEIYQFHILLLQINPPIWRSETLTHEAAYYRAIQQDLA
jgi:hypothetical protein